LKREKKEEEEEEGKLRRKMEGGEAGLNPNGMEGQMGLTW
jgi:hypothetical protein